MGWITEEATFINLRMYLLAQMGRRMQNCAFRY
jgi:hypothetical protein